MRVMTRPRRRGGRGHAAWLLITLPVLTACADRAAPPADDTSSELRLDDYQMVDLTHSFNAATLYWPTSPTRFELEQLAYGLTEAGFFYAANTLSAPEHGGTHLDAPIHFAAGRHTTDQIPLEKLIAAGVVIDVSDAASADPDYRLTVDAVLEFEAVHGMIEAGSIVLLRTGWSDRWPDPLRYLGDDTPGDASNLHFPSYGEDAARLLVDERGVAALGADVASIDYGQSTDFPVHRIVSEANVPGFENVASLERLPAVGAIVIALPMKIEGGSGGPARIVALVPR